MVIPFDAFFRRVAEQTDIVTQMELARVLDVNRSAITQAKLRDAVPQKWILALSRRYTLSPDWLESGIGTPQQGKTLPSLPPQSLVMPDVSLETVLVPKVKATLCAGGGSLDLEAAIISEHPLPRTWLSRLGQPKDMVFMDVVGNSMEPGIYDGDMVLIDQSCTEMEQKTVLAVGYEDAIYIKRLEKRQNGLVMLSDNPDYSSVTVVGDELASFRIIGKVVWLCRDCRYV